MISIYQEGFGNFFEKLIISEYHLPATRLFPVETIEIFRKLIRAKGKPYLSPPFSLGPWEGRGQEEK